MYPKQITVSQELVVDVRELKKYVLEHLSETAPLYQVLLNEKDELTTSEYAIKAELWWRLVGKGYDNSSIRNTGSI